MSQEEYETLARSDPPGPPDPAAPRIDDVDEVDELAYLRTLPPAARRSESLAKMGAVERSFSSEAWAGFPRERTFPSRKSSDPNASYDVAVPPAPAVPALSNGPHSSPHSGPISSSRSSPPSSGSAVTPRPSSKPMSFPERVAASTERPTHVAARAELSEKSRYLHSSVTRDRLKDLALDHRAGFLMSLIDGRASIEEVLDMCPTMPEDEAMSVLADLLRRGIVCVGPRKP
jgi:hypothetical protein